MSTEVDAAADPEAGRRAALADRAGWAGIDTRYAREWLEQQAVAGFLDVEPAGDVDPGQAAGEDWETRRYRLPDPHATCFWTPTTRPTPGPPPTGPAAWPTSAWPSPFVNDLAGWFAATPELQARLAADGARVLDAGCGTGWSSISLARAFPSLRVDGIDADQASIAEARRLAGEAGVADRVRVEHLFWRFYELRG